MDKRRKTSDVSLINGSKSHESPATFIDQIIEQWTIDKDRACKFQKQFSSLTKKIIAKALHRYTLKTLGLA